jgi:hypothetical protein
MIEFIDFSASASVWPHKKAVKKIEAEGAKEKRMLPKLGRFLSLQVAQKPGFEQKIGLVFL